jgi:sterol desaturase/sphingolipid hydroxylase (fatty acid hydroxylase superfamily)
VKVAPSLPAAPGNAGIQYERGNMTSIDALSVAPLYDWQASLAVLVFAVVVSKLGSFVAFSVPALQRMRQLNLTLDESKRAMAKYPPVIRQNYVVGFVMNLAFFLLMLPFIATLQIPPLWKILLDAFVILMVYDFFYYLTHRFLFHGNGALRRVHALHHQARSPSHIDAYYVHPLETFIGIALFMGSAVLCAAVAGRYDVISLGIAYLVFMRLNVINHTKIDLPYFPFRTLTWISAKHAVHHENMHRGNYATITLLYDKLLGTLD